MGKLGCHEGQARASEFPRFYLGCRDAAFEGYRPSRHAHWTLASIRLWSWMSTNWPTAATASFAGNASGASTSATGSRIESRTWCTNIARIRGWAHLSRGARTKAGEDPRAGDCQPRTRIRDFVANALPKRRPSLRRGFGCGVVRVAPAGEEPGVRTGGARSDRAQQRYLDGASLRIAVASFPRPPGCEDSVFKITCEFYRQVDFRVVGPWTSENFKDF